VFFPASAGQLRAFLNVPGERSFCDFEVKNEEPTAQNIIQADP
jgi:hypothetical protein